MEEDGDSPGGGGMGRRQPLASRGQVPAADPHRHRQRELIAGMLQVITEGPVEDAEQPRAGGEPGAQPR